MKQFFLLFIVCCFVLFVFGPFSECSGRENQEQHLTAVLGNIKAQWTEADLNFPFNLPRPEGFFSEAKILEDMKILREAFKKGEWEDISPAELRRGLKYDDIMQDILNDLYHYMTRHLIRRAEEKMLERLDEFDEKFSDFSTLLRRENVAEIAKLSAQLEAKDLKIGQQEDAISGLGAERKTQEEEIKNLRQEIKDLRQEIERKPEPVQERIQKEEKEKEPLPKRTPKSWEPSRPSRYRRPAEKRYLIRVEKQKVSMPLLIGGCVLAFCLVGLICSN